jgi:hypothetical protein
MAVLPRITVEHLLNTYLGFPPSIRQDSSSASFTIALSVIKYYLGEHWLDTHLNPLVSKPGFLRLALGDPAKLDEAARIYIQSFKTVDLGELLFNLHNVEGFDECVNRMKTETLVESGLAEFDFGRMLYINNHKFRFVLPKGKRGDNYDFEITLDKWTLCADVKCKLESSPLTAKTIENVLHDSRDQTPKNKPGTLFIKVPQHWMEAPLYEQILVEGAKAFFRSTERHVSVKYYIAPYEIRAGYLGQGHRFKEVRNPRNRFDKNRSWDLFLYRPPIGATNAMPPKWLRFVDFLNMFLRQ